MTALRLSSSDARSPSTTDEMKTLKINGSRLMETLHSTCEFGKAHPWGSHPTETGMARLALNDDDKRARDWLTQELQAVGCTVTVDQMGNMFGVRPGRNATAPPVMMGSHLDTQPTGGRYDGILGVMAALEALRTLHENEVETRGPVGVVNWTNEEGARFPMVTMASSVWSGSVPLEKAWACEEVINPHSPPRTTKQELERIGYLGTTPSSYTATPMAAHLELHIEQGPILEDEGLKIGVVTGGQAYNWYEVEVKGRDSHAGTTPLQARSDALLGAARMIVEGNRVAKQYAGLVTTGIIRAEPGSVNTLPHTVRFTLDARHPKDEVLRDIVEECRKGFARIAKEDCEKGVEVSWKCLTENPAVQFDPQCIEFIEQAAVEACEFAGVQNATKMWKHLVSGAGHDSCHASKHCPTAMIFTPTRDGMSHTPSEYCSPEDCVIGAQTLFGAMMRVDAARSL